MLLTNITSFYNASTFAIVTDHSAFQPLGCSPNATDIATIEVARQTKFGVIGQLKWDLLQIGASTSFAYI